MKTITFKYEKANKEVSERTLMALSEPNNKYSGIDLSQIEPELAAEFVNKYKELHDEFLANAKALQADYDLTHNYRQFISTNMSDVTEI